EHRQGEGVGDREQRDHSDDNVGIESMLLTIVENQAEYGEDDERAREELRRKPRSKIGAAAALSRIDCECSGKRYDAEDRKPNQHDAVELQDRTSVASARSS